MITISSNLIIFVVVVVIMHVLLLCHPCMSVTRFRGSLDNSASQSI